MLQIKLQSHLVRLKKQVADHKVSNATAVLLMEDSTIKRLLKEGKLDEAKAVASTPLHRQVRSK